MKLYKKNIIKIIKLKFYFKIKIKNILKKLVHKKKLFH